MSLQNVECCDFYAFVASHNLRQGDTITVNQAPIEKVTAWHKKNDETKVVAIRELHEENYSSYWIDKEAVWHRS